MNAILLISVILGISAQDITKKIYNKRESAPGVFIFATLSAVAAAVFFALTSPSLNFNVEFLPYSLAFAAAYTTVLVASVFAIASGPLSLTTLIVSLSLMLPTLYGLVFLNDPISIGIFPGLALLVASLFFINKCDKGVKINTKWVICVSLAFLGNGFCTIVQKMQQLRFEGDFKNEFMIIALVITAAISGLMAWLRERSVIKKQSTSGIMIAIVSGLANGAVNLFVMILSGNMPVSLMFPIISAGGIAATFVISQVFYKEKLSKLQLVGFILGTVSVVLLNF